MNDVKKDEMKKPVQKEELKIPDKVEKVIKKDEVKPVKQSKIFDDDRPIKRSAYIDINETNKEAKSEAPLPNKG